MEIAVSGEKGNCIGIDLPWKLWIYTNFDCNLSCTYCLASSNPRTPRMAIDSQLVNQLVDEAVDFGFESLFFTGGEPLLLDSIYGMLAYASARLPTTLLTNAMLVRGKRLEQLRAVNHPNLVVQVSLDGECPDIHEAYRGRGSWEKTVEGIQQLREHGFRLRLSTTETPANQAHLTRICDFHHSLGVSEEDHIIRPLARRGASQEGMEVARETLSPEITVSARGVFWHPLSTDEDMLVSESIFPLSQAVGKVKEMLSGVQGLQKVK